jgi:formylglycine-generating enzyme required for sulfatase activity
MKRKRIILVALAAVLVAVAGIVVWRWLSPEPAPAPTGLSTPIEMVEIPPGEFLMGSPEDEEGRFDNETQHSVKITYAFKMGKTEVTQQQWREVMGTTIAQQRDKAHKQWSLYKSLKGLGKAIKANPLGAFEKIRHDGLWKTIKAVAVGQKRRLRYGEGDDYPMYFVNWEEATEFCTQLTVMESAAGRIPAGLEYRLPTEAEWEYACRAGSTTRFANGDTDTDLDKRGWYGSNSSSITHPVGTKLPNAWGLHDLHGNIWEWCVDWYGEYGANEAMDPFGPATGSNRVYRGGSWNNPSRLCRSASRVWYAPGIRFSALGFRVVLAPVRPRE